MTLTDLSYNPDDDVVQAAKFLARATSAMHARGQDGALYGHYKAALALLLDPCYSAGPICIQEPERVCN
jgi:hypothetical protein